MSNDRQTWTGEIGPYEYLARRVEKPHRTYVRALVKKDGKPVRARRLVGAAPSSVYHEKPSIEALRRYLYGKVRRQKVPEDNSVDSHPQWRKRLEERREKRQRWREPDVETEYYDGKAHHRLV